MDVRFLTQPYYAQLGKELVTTLDSQLQPTSITIVSAFVARQALRRFKRLIHDLSVAGAHIRFVIGVDMGGTSREVLQELIGWPAEVFVYKNRRSHVTFHPKIYLVETSERADLFIGSNNLTDGGLYTNYESTVHITYDLQHDLMQLDKAKSALDRFLSPKGPVSRKLDAGYLKELLAIPEIPSEIQLRQRRARSRHAAAETRAAGVFGSEALAGAPPLPAELVSAVLKELGDDAATRKRTAKKKDSAGPKTGVAARPQRIDILRAAPSVQLYPTAFYMELVKTKGVIPGEQRIPLEALAAARSFWNWPYAYTTSINPRKGSGSGKSGPDRVYHNFRSMWHVQEFGNANHTVVKEVRLYLYENSSDFRFYSREIAVWGDAGDIIRITPSDEPGVEYDCVLAKSGTAQHAVWSGFCTQTSSHTERVFGFA